MDSQVRSNGSNTRPAIPAGLRAAPRSRVAGRLERVLATALNGERAAVLNVTASELLAEPEAVVAVMEAALHRPGTGVMSHWLAQELLRRSRLHEELLNALASPNPVTRAAAARVCGAARMTDAAIWLADLLDDKSRRVREAAVRSLAMLGGRRAVEALMAASDTIPLYRLAIALSRAATDVDIEALMRKPASEEAAVATVLACGLRGDVLRVSPLLGIAHDRRWPKQVRVAACKALATIGDRAAADGLGRLAANDPDAGVKRVAGRAHDRLLKRALAR
jgi:HEAT repeat protein